MGQIFLDKISSKPYLIFDCRDTHSFCEGHFKNSVFIGDSADTDERLNTLEFEGNDVCFIVKSTDSTSWSLKKMLLPKYDFIIWEEGMAILSSLVDMSIAIDIEEFLLDYEYDEFFLIDVRSAELFEKGKIEYAQSIPAEDISQTIIELDQSKTYYIYGSSFEDALFAESVFKQNGFNFIRVISCTYDEIAAQIGGKKK